MALESHVLATDDFLIGGLDLRLPPGASYIQERRSITMMPSLGNSFSPTGLRLIRFQLFKPK